MTDYVVYLQSFWRVSGSRNYVQMVNCGWLAGRALVSLGISSRILSESHVRSVATNPHCPCDNGNQRCTSEYTDCLQFHTYYANYCSSASRVTCGIQRAAQTRPLSSPGYPYMWTDVLDQFENNNSGTFLCSGNVTARWVVRVGAGRRSFGPPHRNARSTELFRLQEVQL
jgi:hypothetical protein